MAYRKKRILPAANKNAAKALRRRESQNQDQLQERYPNVSRLAIELNFFTPRGEFLERKDLKFIPQDPLDLTVHCPGACGDGHIDLESKVDQIINSGETSGEGKGVCSQPAYTGGAEDMCGYQLNCRIQISYR